MGNYLAKDFFAIFSTNPITIKCTTSPATAASITFSSISHAMKNAAREGRLIITAIRDPFAKRSFLDLFLACHRYPNCSLDAFKV